MLIDIPCKIGDTVYAIRNYKGEKRIKMGIVTEMFFISYQGLYDMRLVIVVGHICRGCWGEKVFGTYEEALTVLKEGDTSADHHD